MPYPTSKTDFVLHFYECEGCFPNSPGDCAPLGDPVMLPEHVTPMRRKCPDCGTISKPYASVSVNSIQHHWTR